MVRSYELLFEQIEGKKKFLQPAKKNRVSIVQLIRRNPKGREKVDVKKIANSKQNQEENALNSKKKRREVQATGRMEGEPGEEFGCRQTDKVVPDAKGTGIQQTAGATTPPRVWFHQKGGR